VLDRRSPQRKWSNDPFRNSLDLKSVVFSFAAAELDFRVYELVSTLDCKAKLPPLRRFRLLGLRCLSDRDSGGTEDCLQRCGLENGIDLLCQGPSLHAVQVEINVFGVADRIEEIAKVRAALKDVA
jgi:hypothetical protein